METPGKSLSTPATPLEVHPFPGTQQPSWQWSSRLQVCVMAAKTSHEHAVCEERLSLKLIAKLKHSTSQSRFSQLTGLNLNFITEVMRNILKSLS
ncbi:uncharacterized protein O9250_015782 isoform 2-T2 [Rhynochetos jubatus]